MYISVGLQLPEIWKWKKTY